MSSNPYLCLWFDQNAKQAVNYYSTIFPNCEVQSESPLAIKFKLQGMELMALNGGPMYQQNPSISYYVYCGSLEETARLYEELAQGGKILMPLNKYDWSECYGWVQDSFGVNWQLDYNDINSNQKIVPALLFANEKKEKIGDALGHYSTVFSDFEILTKVDYPKAEQFPENALLFAQFKISGTIFNAMSSVAKHDFDFTPANSVVVECDTQDEIDHYWEKLGLGGAFSQCGWLNDKYGVSWQVVPAILPQLMQNPEKRDQVIQAFLKMKKFDIAALENA